MNRSPVRFAAAWVPLLALACAGCAAHATSASDPRVEAKLAWGGLMAMFFAVFIIGGLLFVAVRKGWKSGRVVVGLLLGLMMGAFWFSFFAYQARHHAEVRHATLVQATELDALLEAHSVSDGDVVPIEAIVLAENHAVSAPSELTGAARTAPLPEWVEEGTEKHGGTTLALVSGRQFADPAEAREDALRQATDLLLKDFEANALRPMGERRDGWSLRTDAVQALAVRNAHTEEIRRSAGENEFTVYRTHLQVELSPAVRELVEPAWRQQVSMIRSVNVGGILALVTALAAVVAGYFRLDDRTGGQRRWLLRFGALAATALVGLTVMQGTTAAEHAVRTHYSAPETPVRILEPPTPVPVQPITPPDPHRLIHFDDEIECPG